MRVRTLVTVIAVVATVVGFSALSALALSNGDVLVTSGSAASPFSGNKQNEPAVAIDPMHTNILAAGANDNIDMEACNAGTDNTCPFSPDVGSSGISFSFDSGASWVQPTYTGLTARNCVGVVGDTDPDCTPTIGPIGTVPNYFEAGLASGGDPAVAFGPTYRDGTFSWDNGSRLYYANLTARTAGSNAFNGDEAVGVSYTDNLEAAATGDNSAWSVPVVASRQSSAQFSDKEQIWADNSQSSPFFGNVYVCYAQFRGHGKGFTNQPLSVLRSTDGGTTWTQTQVTPASNNIKSPQGFGRSGCTVRTDSHGKVYVFAFQFGFAATGAAPGQILMITSSDGGSTWARPVSLFTAFDTCNEFEASIARCVEDGVGGARDDLGPAPSVDIANGAPLGTDATNRIVLTWVDGRDGSNHEHVMFTSSADGASWSDPIAVEQTGDRGYYSAPAISPNGSDVYLVYNAFTTPFRTSTEGPGNDRQLVGVVLGAHATNAGVGSFTEIHRGASGDARGSSQNNLAAEFLGDYVYAAATRTYGAAVWNDVRNAADCPAVDTYRQDLHDEAVATGAQTAESEEPGDLGLPDQGAVAPVAPPIETDCPPNFGNSDIFGGTFAVP